MGGQNRRTDAASDISRPRTLLTKHLLSAALLGCTSLWLPAYALVHLSATLPHEYQAGNWRLVWVLFDLGVAALVATDCVLLLLRSSVLPVLAGLTAGCFLCDAWFDCMTSRGSPSSLLDLAGEIPAAAFCIWTGLAGSSRERIQAP
jgi:hypothetical protein